MLGIIRIQSGNLYKPTSIMEWVKGFWTLLSLPQLASGWHPDGAWSSLQWFQCQLCGGAEPRVRGLGAKMGISPMVWEPPCDHRSAIKVSTNCRILEMAEIDWNCWVTFVIHGLMTRNHMVKKLIVSNKHTVEQQSMCTNNQNLTATLLEWW